MNIAKSKVVPVEDDGDESEDSSRSNPEYAPSLSAAAAMTTPQNNSSTPWKDLLLSPFFCGRVFLLLLALALSTLSAAYSLAQQVEVKLSLITFCPEPKTQEAIWRHSYEAGMEDGEIAITEESQWGRTDDDCWTTRSLQVQSGRLWGGNSYTHSWSGINAYSVMFAVLAVFAVGSGGLNVYSMAVDAIDAAENRLHCKSKGYIDCVRHLQQTQSIFHFEKRPIVVLLNSMKRTYRRLNGWIASVFVSETLEIILQSQALLLHNGYRLFSDGEYLANKPDAILLFAVLISANCLIVASLWLLYLHCGPKRKGLLFKTVIFCSDQMSDILYTVYPILVILMDEYTANTNVYVVLSQLSIDEPVLFLATAFPLFCLCTKCISLGRDMRSALRNQAYSRWKASHRIDVDTVSNALEVDPAKFSRMAKSYGVDAEERPETLEGALSVEKEMDDRVSVPCSVKVILSVICVLFVAYSVALFYSVSHHLGTAEDHCSSFTEERLFRNGSTLSDSDRNELGSTPELFVWDQCLYKAREREDLFNLTQPAIMEGVMARWYMMEKMKTTGNGGTVSQSHRFNSSVRLQFLKAFEWADTAIDHNESGSLQWGNLEYLVLTTTRLLRRFPLDLSYSNKLQFLSLTQSGLRAIPESICSLNQLKILHFSDELYLSSVPHCVGDLVQLQAIWIDKGFLVDVPLSLFSLPNLKELSLYNNEIDFESLLEYNLPSNLTLDESQWFAEHFAFDDRRTSYWISMNPICDENMTAFPPKLVSFLNLDTACPVGNPCSLDIGNGVADEFCPPRLLGDGHCDWQCANDGCAWDHGDCSQLCFAPELTNCTLDLLMNSHCDTGCNHSYCGRISSTIGYNLDMLDGQLTSIDMGECTQLLEDGANDGVVPEDCEDSQSIFTDSNVLSMYPDYDGECDVSSIGDATCDDQCRSADCLMDGGDCNEGKVCVSGSVCEILWTWFMTAAWNSNVANQIEHSYFCHGFWSYAQSQATCLSTDALEWPFWSHTVECSQAMPHFDFNSDGHLNFRELTAIGAYGLCLGSADGNPVPSRVFGMNCSECSGTSNYNPLHQ